MVLDSCRVSLSCFQPIGSALYSKMSRYSIRALLTPRARRGDKCVTAYWWSCPPAHRARCAVWSLLGIRADCCSGGRTGCSRIRIALTGARYGARRERPSPTLDAPAAAYHGDQEHLGPQGQRQSQGQELSKPYRCPEREERAHGLDGRARSNRQTRRSRQSSGRDPSRPPAGREAFPGTRSAGRMQYRWR